MKKINRNTAIFIVLAILWQSGNTQLFTEQTGILLTGIYGSFAWGDYDNDNDLDILLSGESKTGGVSKIYRNNGNNTFTEQTSITLMGLCFSNVAWGDYNNDNYLDILMTGCDDFQCSHFISKIFRNNGDNSFSEQLNTNLTGVAGGYSTWGDYDNDGDLDILLSGTIGNFINISKIYRNNGDNTFTDQNDITLTGVTDGSGIWGDYDNDGDLDAFLSGCEVDYSSNFYSIIYKNEGNGSLIVQDGIPIEGIVGSSVWGDYDEDGNLDILLSGMDWYENEITKIYHNNGDNTFSEQNIITSIQFGSHSANWCDYDNDGDPDILLPTTIDSFYIATIHRNDGDNTFSEQSEISDTGITSIKLAPGDYDNDGDPDMLITGYDSSINKVTQIYRNNVLASNATPSTPANLYVTVDGDNTVFKWDRSADAETSQKGLSYNLAIRNTDNGKMYNAPMSDLITGYRRIVAMGNANLDTSWIIKKLYPGNYRAYAQAIDNAFAGSNFDSVNFTVTGAGNNNTLTIEDIIVFPVPASDEIIIQSQLNELEVELFDCMGSCVYMGTLKGSKKLINVSAMPKGVYFLKVHKDIKTGITIKVAVE